MHVTAEIVSEFIFSYARRYREEYAQLTTPAPNGPGYPALIDSPYISESDLDIFITNSGVAIVEIKEPTHLWYIAHGPSLKIDYKHTRTPASVTKYCTDNGLSTHTGIYRIAAKKTLPAPVWKGHIQNTTRKIITKDEKLNITLNIYEINSPLNQLVNELTFGAYGIILKLHLPDQNDQFGSSHITRNLGMFPADLNNRRFFKHLEILGHSDTSAWDARIVNLRVHKDIRRDLAESLSNPQGRGGGYINFGTGQEPSWIESYSNRLTLLQTAISELRAAMQLKGDGVEAVFHEILAKHTLLLDVYGLCESKPEFSYPNGLKSPIGKSKLQPDFLIKYPDQSYKLIEIERPAKSFATVQGQPRAEVTQAVFQTAEWKHYIATHYQTIAHRYPDIQTKCKTSVIMSRSNQESFKNIEDIKSYMGLIKIQYNIDEILTFDDLLERACTAYALLSGLNPKS